MAKPDITQEYLHSILHYDPITGVFTYKVKRSSRALKGAIAGAKDRRGYLSIKIDYVAYYAHRLAWFYIHGEWPKDQLDHVDGDKTNNALHNLREATAAQNTHNRPTPRNNKTGFKGVDLTRGGKYRAAICIGYQHRFLGYFDTAEEAHAAYCKAAQELHGEYARLS
jgi:hypothetical protein